MFTLTTNKNIFKTSISLLKHSFSSDTSLVKKLPEYLQAESSFKSQKYSQAISSYKKTLQILKQAKIQQNTYEYNLVLIKVLGTMFLNADYQKLVNEFNSGLSTVGIENREVCIFVWFTESMAARILDVPTSQETKNREQIQLIQLGNILLSKQKVQEQIHQTCFPFLTDLFMSFNNSLDPKKLILSLLNTQKLKLSPEEQLTVQNLQSALNYSTISPGIQLLYHLSTTLTNRIAFANSEYKSQANSRINQILNQYQQRQGKSQYLDTYQPLINIVCNLIKEKQYMSGEGILGHIKSGESGLFLKDSHDKTYGGKVGKHQIQEKVLVENLYRMMVTRAANQDFSSVWPKVNQFKPGLFIAQRLIYESIKNMDERESMAGIFI